MKQAIFALLLAALLAGATGAEKPVLAVLPYTAEGHQEFSEQVRRALHEKLARSYQFVVIETMDVDAAMARAGFELTDKTPTVQVAEMLGEHLGASCAVWGFARRAEPKGWVFGFRFLDAAENPTEPEWVMERLITQYRELPLLVGDVADRIAGFSRLVGAEPQVPEGKRLANPPNLLKNGDFEQGPDSPDHWQPVNNLTTFWHESGLSGRCLKIDTDVLESQVLTWLAALEQGADVRRPPRKLPTKPPKYNTVGGTYGVHFHSDPLPAKRGMVYRLSLDLKGPSKPKVFVKGYAAFEATDFGAQDREIYRMYLSCESQTNGAEWERHTRTFLPNAHYVVFDIENLAGTRHAALATLTLRALMDKRGFPRIPRAPRERILEQTGFKAAFGMDIPEILVNLRDHLRCAHGIYGKVEKAEGGVKLFLNLTSARIKQNVPLVAKQYDVADEAGLTVACNDFLDHCQRRFPFVEYVRVIPYAYWKPGTYLFDNIRLTEEGDDLW